MKKKLKILFLILLMLGIMCMLSGCNEVYTSVDEYEVINIYSDSQGKITALEVQLSIDDAIYNPFYVTVSDDIQAENLTSDIVILNGNDDILSVNNKYLFKRESYKGQIKLTLLGMSNGNKVLEDKYVENKN